jgi:hypothetical protein
MALSGRQGDRDTDDGGTDMRAAVIVVRWERSMDRHGRRTGLRVVC